MDYYFLDTGIIIGFSLFYRKESLPSNIFSVEIDAQAENCDSFIEKYKNDTYVIARITYSVELNSVINKFDRRIKLLLSQVNSNPPPTFTRNFSTEDLEWVKSKKTLFVFNKKEVYNLFLDLVATMKTRIDYLIKNYIKTNIHNNYNQKVKSHLYAIHNNNNDSIIFATCIDYHNRNNKCNFVTTDKNDYGKILSTQIEGFDIPIITYI